MPPILWECNRIYQERTINNAPKSLKTKDLREIVVLSQPVIVYLGPDRVTGNGFDQTIHSFSNGMEITRILTMLTNSSYFLCPFYKLLWPVNHSMLVLHHFLILIHHHFPCSLAQVVAKGMGLDTRTNSSFWKDRAVVELNTAVQYSFQVICSSISIQS